MRMQKAEGKEKVAASLVRSFVANLFPSFLPPCVFSPSLGLLGHARKGTVSLADCERREWMDEGRHPFSKACLQHSQPVCGSWKSQASSPGPTSTEHNLFHHGETTYRVGWLSENVAGMLYKKDVWKKEAGLIQQWCILTFGKYLEREREREQVSGKCYPSLRIKVLIPARSTFWTEST